VLSTRTVAFAVAVALAFALEQVIVNVVVRGMPVTRSVYLPFVADLFGTLRQLEVDPFDAIHDAAPVTSHVRSEKPPRDVRVGFAERVTVTEEEMGGLIVTKHGGLVTD